MTIASRRAAGILFAAALALPVLATTGCGRTGDDPAASRAARDAGPEQVRRAFEAKRSNVWVEGSGVVERHLADDQAGSRHQRFILRLAPDLTLLVSHNIDLAPRMPAQPGETVTFRGEYEWNTQGGLIHWTHHDPQRRHDGGWLEHNGRRYR